MTTITRTKHKRKRGADHVKSLISFGGDLLISPSLDPTLHFPVVEYSIEYCHQRKGAFAVGQASERMV
jgi:2-keto-3-deoxy-6-phosphogluconate aldolase